MAYDGGMGRTMRSVCCHSGAVMKLALSIVVLLLAVTSLALAAEQPEHIDPVSVSPGKYRVLLENEHVRVLEYRIEPGQKEEWHTHPPKVSYIVSGGALRITTAGGESFVVTENADNATWMNAVDLHFGENVGKTTLRIVLIEIKSLADAPFEAIGERE